MSMEDLLIKHSDTLSHGFIRCLLSPCELPQVTFGSTSEGLKCVAAHDMGDFDLMLFSSREEMLLNVDRLHDIPECPGFVHIHGVGHPALKDCLYQDTEYVAISALKDFHPSVFREASAFLQIPPTLITIFSYHLDSQIMSTKLGNSCQSGPAITMEIAQSFTAMLHDLPQTISRMEINERNR